MASIYELDRQLLDCINEETGEIDAERFEALQLERDAKIGNIIRWLLDIKGDVQKLRDEEKRIADKRHVLENRAESLKKYLDYALNGEKWTDGIVTASYRKTPAKLDFADEEKFVEWALTEHDELVKFQAPTIDKEKVKELLKAGEELPGVQLMSGTTITIK